MTELPEAFSDRRSGPLPEQKARRTKLAIVLIVLAQVIADEVDGLRDLISMVDFRKYIDWMMAQGFLQMSESSGQVKTYGISSRVRCGVSEYDTPRLLPAVSGPNR